MPPWQLLEVPGAPAWIEIALQMLDAENHAKKVQHQQRGKRTL